MKRNTRRVHPRDSENLLFLKTFSRTFPFEKKIAMQKNKGAIEAV